MRRKLIPIAILALLTVLLVAACSDGGNSTLSSQRDQAVNDRAHAFARAQGAVPVPKNVNFPLRKTLVTMTQRDDMLNHPWYIYVLSAFGSPIGYYVAKTDPVNACDFLSSTEDLHHDGDKGGYAITTAPSYDGMYYGGGGASAGCDAWVFLDEASNALVKIRSYFFVADQPLTLKVPQFKIAK